MRDNWILCPTCRQHSDLRSIAFADDSQNKSLVERSENFEASVFVQGSYGTKVLTCYIRNWIARSLMVRYYCSFYSKYPVGSPTLHTLWHFILGQKLWKFTCQVGPYHVRHKYSKALLFLLVVYVGTCCQTEAASCLCLWLIFLAWASYYPFDFWNYSHNQLWLSCIISM